MYHVSRIQSLYHLNYCTKYLRHTDGYSWYLIASVPYNGKQKFWNK